MNVNNTFWRYNGLNRYPYLSWEVQFTTFCVSTNCVHCWHHVVTGVDCWQFALGHLDICPSIDLCLHIFFGFKCGIWTAPSKETKIGKFVLVGWGSTFKLVIVSLSRYTQSNGEKIGKIHPLWDKSPPGCEITKKNKDIFCCWGEFYGTPN